MSPHGRPIQRPSMSTASMLASRDRMEIGEVLSGISSGQSRGVGIVLTLKQLEALVLIDKVGSLGAAADRLHTTPSAISKRISEIEACLGVPMMVPGHSRGAGRLTADGREVIRLSEEIFRLRDKIIEEVGDGKRNAGIKRLRLGVTELVALTFLQALILRIREDYPTISIEPEIDLSTRLHRKLEDGEIDLVIGPSIGVSTNFVWLPLETLQFSWMAAPAIAARHARWTIDDILRVPMIVQIGTSGVDALYDQWFQKKNLEPKKVYAGNSLAALSALTISGFGISYLPTDYFSNLIAKKTLCALDAADAPLSVDYYAIYRKDGSTPVLDAIAKLARATVNFHFPM